MKWTCYGYDLIVCICRNVLPVGLYLLIFQLYLLFAATMFMANKDYQKSKTTTVLEDYTYLNKII